jgi:hypothetical protein
MLRLILGIVLLFLWVIFVPQIYSHWVIEMSKNYFDNFMALILFTLLFALPGVLLVHYGYRDLKKKRQDSASSHSN